MLLLKGPEAKKMVFVEKLTVGDSEVKFSLNKQYEVLNLNENISALKLRRSQQKDQNLNGKVKMEHLGTIKQS